MLGKLLANRYRIGDRIGGGGMALVYRAEDLQLGRDVAVKVLRTQFGSDEEFVRRFRREAQNAASLSHPNVVQIFDVGQEEDQYFIVMELVEGKTLKELIHEQGPLPVAEAGRIAMEILGALSHAHRNRIVHRDIKPHNILIARDGRVKVTDFGIARATTTDTVTHTGSIMGSAHYFSPEQANGQPTGDKSDIYSVGIVLYEMVTGTVPFQGESPITVALKHLREPVTPPSHRNSEVPVELEEIILRALEKEPEDRYASAEAMREAISELLQLHAAGRTHMPSGDFPTMDLRGMRGRKLRRALDEEEDADGDDDDLTPGRPRGRSRTWIWVAVVATVVLLLIGGGVYGFVSLLETPEVEVPNVVGMSLVKAQDELKAAKLTSRVIAQQYNNEVPDSHVIRTDPDAGVKKKLGGDVGLILSKGPEQKALPDVRGQSLENASALLQSERFKVGAVTQRSSTYPEGQVIEMTPQPLTQIPVGSAVNLVVSQGPLRVPPIYGLLLPEARQRLTAAGFIVGRVDSLPDPTKPKDTVLSSDPQQGTVVSQGAIVNLVISQGAGTGQTFQKEITVTGEPGKIYEVKITLVDAIPGQPQPTETPISTQRRTTGEKFTVRGTFLGAAYLRVTVDGREQPRIPLP